VTWRPESLYQRLSRRVRRLVPSDDFRAVQQRIRGGSGIEIGGPSAVFQRWNLWPLYPAVGRLEYYDFASHTIWSEQPPKARRLTLLPGRPPQGRRVVGEASDMKDVPSATYDFLLASHVLEHIANPLKALHDWARVLVPDGTIVLVVPHRDGTFDHRRPITSMDHILNDFELDVGENDQTHLREILELHDLSRDPGAGGREAFVARASDNLTYRSLHHHVFDTELVLRLLDRAGLHIFYVDVERPYHICVGCSHGGQPSRTSTLESQVTNSTYWSPIAEWRRKALFPSDSGSRVSWPSGSTLPLTRPSRDRS
jgi:SAM-dependent methyltransferase